MKQKTWIIILAVLAAVLVAAAAWLWIGLLNGSNTPEAQADPAPDFTVYTQDGQAVKLSDYKGKPLVLNFWASWCGPCKSEMPAFQAAYEELGGEVQFLMVNLTSGYETMDTATAFLAESGYTFPVLFDTQRSGAAVYSVASIPATYFIDADGNIVASHIGAMSEATLRSYLDKIA